MSRDSRLFLEDILASVEATSSYLAGALRGTLDVDLDIVWDAATREVPLLGTRVREMLDELSPS
jgi:uncharacterized protein with HEPN domain